VGPKRSGVGLLFLFCPSDLTDPNRSRCPPLCHPDRSEVEPCFCPSHLTAPNRSHHPPLCHPERTRISYFAGLPAATYAALRKESRMKSTEATVFDRKSGAAEGSAVRPDSRTKASAPLVLPQNRHPERSALQIYCVTQRLWRGVEGPRRCLIYLCCSELFNHRARTGPARHCLSLEPRTPDHRVRIAADPVVGLRRPKSSEQHR
jgi:hypothetical protein